jgi:hypothetical protein
VVELEDDDEEMTEAFRLRSASEGLWVGSSGEDAGGPTVIMSRRRHNRGWRGRGNEIVGREREKRGK